MKTTFTFLLLLAASLGFAQLPKPDEIPTSKGPLKIQPLNHATLALTWNGKTIYADPYQAPKTFVGIAKPDLIVITDIHGDHFDPASLDALDLTNTIIVAPQAVADKMSEALKAKTTVLANGATTEKLGISITAIPMYNLPETADSRHTKGRGNGYVLKLGGKSVFLSGDTSGIPEIKALKNIDVAFVCMNLPYTMDINEAAATVLAFKPKVVYPYHYRGQNGFSDTEAFKKLVNEKDGMIDVRVRDWYTVK
ncbi:L-ascorbate metabolism protein UlaG (beta-lactamase superfamily) [Dyadobacter sp. BE34]|uniref:L-ascorbate metabolism protein UlaG (Beta-lactamase superfamily) n=1 Tax=Dyadobacter fermentans TaxID=94254 RepID=A0ABU1QW64_9BACT|nr:MULTISPECIES: MBL fold metallo-hydrolase [Dyadobacter]MDR6805401.1 L-ascorbate metabolism protein UlaG (beta-lactamase superfamily) [Dyadobacter fermentans]MDR7042839.1 L-ascorbate metabolism protein UlaG (beta-lactamase superfamily) [Dyadobacter sp. BE242]MDR7197151.1 L-ascorbate metabolism protein UlaG (beta-lactamase superfamily) [Dyadobacter sp. BE34]MDR7215414.1 L-ascorbate metabolism protein UlaG (beta-lactamase superfamily) [Dyadobacter sp. BE31]MDR7262950.1 L-ascorbate metabolism pr